MLSHFSTRLDLCPTWCDKWSNVSLTTCRVRSSSHQSITPTGQHLSFQYSKQMEQCAFVGNYKTTINCYSKLDSYPLPKAEDLFTTLMDGQTFTKLDLTNTYGQMELDDDSKPYTCINIHRGRYMYNRCPFGIRSAAPIFQRKMETLLKTVPKKVVFQDDILVTGKSQHEHLKNRNEVLNRLSQAGFLAINFGDLLIFFVNNTVQGGHMMKPLQLWITEWKHIFMGFALLKRASQKVYVHSLSLFHFNMSALHYPENIKTIF